jgi:acyl-CoA thioesterase
VPAERRPKRIVESAVDLASVCHDGGRSLRYDRSGVEMDREGRASARLGGPTESSPSPPGLEARIAADPYGRWLGIELLELRPGYCRAALTLAPHMANFHGSSHGGAIFSLADFAFAGACNGHGEPAVALTVTIQFHAAARVGRRLVAEARETRQGKRAGFYAMTVTDAADGTVVATCQAVSLRTDAHRPR